MKKIVSPLLALALCLALAAPAQAYGVGSTARYATVADGADVSAVVDPNNTLWMWGSNSVGQLGNGGKGDKYAEDPLDGAYYAIQTTPARILDNVVSVSLGEEHTAAIRTDGSLWMWGFNAQGQVGNGRESDGLRDGNPYQSTPVKVLDNVAAVACGSKYTAAIRTDGSLWTWGSNFYGELGNGGGGNVDVPYYGVIGQSVPIKVMDNVTAVSCGSGHTAAIRSDGSLWLWGENYSGQLGIGSMTDSLKPVKVMENVVSVACGSEQITAAVKSDGSLWVWGNIGYGNGVNGYGARVQTTPLRVIASGVSYVSCIAYYNSVNAVKSDGTLLLWQRGSSKQALSDVAQASGNLASKQDGSVWIRDYDDAAFRRLSGLTAGSVSKTTQSTGTADPPSDWARPEIDAARDAGLLTPRTSGGYQADISRLQFAELIVNLIETVTGSDIVPAPKGTFSDCDEECVRKAYTAGVIGGDETGRFLPERTTNREQIATMIARAIWYIEEETGANYTPAAPSIARFSDKDSVSGWAAEAVGLLVSNGIMGGTSGTTLSPGSSCTVEQSILLVYRFFTRT